MERSTFVPAAVAAGVWRRSWTTWDESLKSARWWTQARESPGELAARPCRYMARSDDLYGKLLQEHING